jgi:hypothetical protein
MELVEKLKTRGDLNILWNDDNEGILGTSHGIVRAPYKFEEQLLIMEGDGDIYMRFSCDDDNYFWIPVLNESKFLHLFDIYTNRIGMDEYTDLNPQNKMLTELPFEKTVYFYGGLCPDIEKLETKMKFNNYLCLSKKNYCTSPWLSEQPGQIRSYKTIYSNSLITFQLLTKFSVQLDTKDGTKRFHPMFIKINYPETDHTGIRYKIMGDCMLYDVLDKEMPYDVWAAMQAENVLDEPKIKEMLEGMDKDWNSEKDYFNFVLAALDEMSTNPL